jgi:pimeloyl-ACP methyl ester carboxylesterase
MPRPTLIMLPGLLNTRRLFERQIADLSDIADIIVPELWHHDTVGAIAQDILDTAPPKFALLGFSMGGYVAFEMFRRAPDRIERLALIDTQAAPDPPEAAARRRAFIEQTKLGRFHGVHSTLLPQIIHPSRLEDAAVTQPILDMAKEIGGDGFVREQQAILGRVDSRPLLVDIEVPAVVIVGRQDQATPVHQAEQMATDIANARLVVLEECGHVSPLERPAEVSAALRRWLSE